ncbi:MAG: serine protein kinase PrkA [Deltaproteobacteria bacterium]|nr:serine protein kinase PrkA [Deltaproteobacteria bacterium]
METRALLDGIVNRIRGEFAQARSLLAVDDYLSLLGERPRQQLRGAAQYLFDVFEHFGTETLRRSYGDRLRYRLFDAPFDNGLGRVAGQEAVQGALYRLLRNFLRAGRIDRLILLHGPNGSAKTSLIHCLARAAEVYSRTEQGALYTINWVFPSPKVQKGSIGFGSKHGASSALGSYALLESADLDARVPCEVRDHPLLLFPPPDRAALVRELKQRGALPEDFVLPEVLERGDLCSRCRAIADALLATHHGDFAEVLRHVQVERLLLSRRYRRGIVSVEPQMSVDAYSRPVTADRSLASLPIALQNLVLISTGGPLVEGNRGIVEYNDLLKRPIEAFKYLLSTTESASASLEFTTVFLDTVLIASSNEAHLDAFKEYPDWQSFKGRIELIPVPYLRRYSDEVQIYQRQIPPSVVDRHIAPHALELAARWAVLTRLEPPDADRYPEAVQRIVRDLTPAEKLALYDQAQVPERLTTREARDLRSIVADLFDERRDVPDYEGRFGASAREVRGALMNAAQNPHYKCLSPLAVLDELRQLCREKTLYDYLRRETEHGFRDAVAFVDEVEKQYLDAIDEEVCISMGLVAESSYQDLFGRYVRHLSAWVKGEKVPHPVSGELQDPDATLMTEIEEILLSSGEQRDDFRNSVISQIGAYSLDHPGEAPPYGEIFPGYLRKLQDDFFNQRRKQVQRAKENLLRVIHGETAGLDAKSLQRLQGTLETMRQRFGYCEHCTADMVSFLMKKRYTD